MVRKNVFSLGIQVLNVYCIASRTYSIGTLADKRCNSGARSYFMMCVVSELRCNIVVSFANLLVSVCSGTRILS